MRIQLRFRGFGKQIATPPPPQKKKARVWCGQTRHSVKKHPAQQSAETIVERRPFGGGLEKVNGGFVMARRVTCVCSARATTIVQSTDNKHTQEVGRLLPGQEYSSPKSTHAVKREKW